MTKIHAAVDIERVDIVTTYTPSFVLVSAISDDGVEWLSENCPDLDASGAVDHRYIMDLIYGAVDDGLAVQDTETGLFAHSLS